jgi:hypothetical protein
MCYRGCAGSQLPTRLSLQFGKLQGESAKLQGKESPYSSRNPPHLKTLDSQLPSLTSRENLSHSREASRADEVFGTHSPPRDFRVSARVNSTKKRLYRFKRDPWDGNLAEISGEVGSYARPLKYIDINDLVWLCWQSEPNPSLPAFSGTCREIP